MTGPRQRSTLRDRVILLVEDSADDVLLIRRALDKNRIANRVEVAGDGVVALEMLFGRGEWSGGALEPELVLLDLKLPRVDGLEVLAALRADPRTRRLPVVVLTSSREERDLLRSYDLGVNSYVVKPLDFGALTDCVRQLGLYWLVLNEPPPEGVGA